MGHVARNEMIDLIDSGERHVTIWRPSSCPSVCPVGILTETHHEVACDAALRAFRPDNKERRTDVVVEVDFMLLTVFVVV